MRNVSRPAILISAAVAAATLATPAFASSPTTDAHTSLNARASKAVVAPRHTDTVFLTLRSRKVGVADEAEHFAVRMRRDSSSTKWSTWATVAATPGTADGRYRVSVTMPPKIAKGKKEQFQVRFTGDSARHLAASRSQVFTVTAG
jgi:hypothetical protein